MVDKHLDSFSVAVYLWSLLITGASFSMLQWAIRRHISHSGQVHDEHEAAQGIHQRRAVSRRHSARLPGSMLGLACAAGVTLLWIIHTLGIQHHDKTQ